MAIRNLRLDGDEILLKKSREVEVIDERIQELIDDMIETMHKYNGVGLAAVQVGILKRIVVIDLYDDNGPIVLINPKIIKTEGEQEVEEGCANTLLDPDPTLEADVISLKNEYFSEVRGIASLPQLILYCQVW